MSGESIIRIVEDVILEDGCTSTWRYIDEGDGVPYYWCEKHKAHVHLTQPCPKSEVWARRGETVTVPSKVAQRLVDSGLAEYPTHAPEIDEGVRQTVDRVNALMDEQGLPHMTPESMNVWKIEGKQQNPYGRPAKPSDRRLAGDLGMDATDIAEMRKLAGGS